MDNVTAANLALSAIGSRSTIASLSENSVEAQQCNLHFAPALDAILSASRWNFARRQVLLTLLNDATQNQPVPTPWMYEYAYPSDCVQGRMIMPTVQIGGSGALVGTPVVPTAVGPAVRFLVSTDLDPNGNQIMVILTNQPQATFVYTSRVQNPNLWDGQFTEAFRYYLGARIAMQLTGDKGLAAAAFKQADTLCKQAAASDNNEGLTIIDNVPDWMKVRGYASDWGQQDTGFYSYGPVALSAIV